MDAETEIVVDQKYVGLYLRAFETVIVCSLLKSERQDGPVGYVVSLRTPTLSS